MQNRRLQRWVSYGLHQLLNGFISFCCCVKIETSIVERMKKAFDTRVKLTKETEEMCNSVGITVDQLEMKLPELREEEIKRLDSIARKPG